MLIIVVVAAVNNLVITLLHRDYRLCSQKFTDKAKKAFLAFLEEKKQREFVESN